MIWQKRADNSISATFRMMFAHVSTKLRSLNKLFFAFCALVWFLGRMCKRMSIEMTFMSKLLFAFGALIWRLTSVCSQMIVQVMLQRELFATVFTFERLHARMSKRMDLQTARNIKLLLTHGTFVGPFTPVYSIVYAKRIRMAELFATFIAFEWLLSRVNTRMNYQIISPRKLLSAQRTLVMIVSTYLSHINFSSLRFRFRWIRRRRDFGAFRLLLRH